METYDVIVVGAGTAGTLAAKTTANAGLKTLLVESKPREKVGDKVCGDALGDHHLKELNLGPPNNGAFENRIQGIKIFSPDEENVFTVENKDFRGVMLDRQLFGQWLLKKAIDAGASLLDSTMFLEPIIDKGVVRGIVARDKSGKKSKIKSRVVIDASGYFGVVRNKLPTEMGIEGKLANEDVEICYREIRQLDEEMENTDYCEIYLNQTNTPGGYMWIFPKKEGQVNAGLGVHMHGNYPSPKEIFYNHTLTKPIFLGSEIIKMGGGFDPTRRPIDKMVGNGVVLIGDAASLVNPIHGGGIGPSMKSGFYAGQAIIEALGKGKATEENLWSYSYKFMRSYGKVQASLDVFRRFLISTDDTELNYGMKNKLLTESDILKAGQGEDFDLKITDKARRVFRGIQRPHFLNKLRMTVKLMRHVKSHYEEYPEEPDDFENWRLKTVMLIDQARTKIQR